MLNFSDGCLLIFRVSLEVHAAVTLQCLRQLLYQSRVYDKLAVAGLQHRQRAIVGVTVPSSDFSHVHLHKLVGDLLGGVDHLNFLSVLVQRVTIESQVVLVDRRFFLIEFTTIL